MQFYEKFDFLMRLTSTSNALISQKTKLDPSYISRLRNGKRNPIRDKAVIQEMATHFARQCTNPHHIELMDDIVDEGYTNSALQERIELIALWLGMEHHTSKWVQVVHKAKQKTVDGRLRTKRMRLRRAESPAVYHGVKGKIQAVERLLDRVIRSPYPVHLSLLTDESMSWMTEDPHHRERLNKAVSAMLAAGHSIRTIHRVDRNFSEMLTAINQWLPYYATGRVQSYYYPRTRDGLYQRTLFVAPGIGAVSSGSINEHIEESVNLYVTEKRNIEAFEKEFEQILALCKPLTHPILHGDRQEYLECLETFDYVQGRAMGRTQSLSLVTMPKTLVRKICNRNRDAETWLPKLYRKRRKAFTSSLEMHDYHEIVPVLSQADVEAGRIPLTSSNIMHSHPLYYSKNEYIEHLEHILELIDRYPHFYATLQAEASPVPYSLHVKESMGALLINHTTPPVIITVFERNITDSLYEYLHYLAGTRRFVAVDDEREKERLSKYIATLRAL